MKENNNDFSKYIPVKNIGWEEGDDGKVYLLKEKFKNKMMKRMIDISGKGQYFRIHLDETGTQVWENINGTNNIRKIGEIIKKKRGESFTQAEKRVEQFVVLMLKNKFIKLVQEK